MEGIELRVQGRLVRWLLGHHLARNRFRDHLLHRCNTNKWRSDINKWWHLKVRDKEDIRSLRQRKMDSRFCSMVRREIFYQRTCASSRKELCSIVACLSVKPDFMPRKMQGFVFFAKGLNVLDGVACYHPATCVLLMKSCFPLVTPAGTCSFVFQSYVQMLTCSLVHM